MCIDLFFAACAVYNAFTSDPNSNAMNWIVVIDVLGMIGLFPIMIYFAMSGVGRVYFDAITSLVVAAW